MHSTLKTRNEIWLGNLTSAQLLLEEALSLHNLAGLNKKGYLISSFGELNFRQKKYEKALANFEAGMEIGQQNGDKRLVLWSKVSMGHALVRKGELSRAKTELIACAQQFQEANEIGGLIYSIEGMASLALVENQLTRGALLYGHADKLREVTDDNRPPVEQADVDRELAAIQDQIGLGVFSAAIQQGKNLTANQRMEELYSGLS